ncbi:MAG: MipA/OmpV family protein [Pseudomonadales bacterium]
MKRILLFLMLVTTLLVDPAIAADIASDVRSGGGVPDTSDGGYFEIGVAAGYLANPRVNDDDDEGWEVGLSLAGGYRYKGFFVEASQGTFDGLNLGYNLWNNKHWSVDLLASSLNGDIDTDNADRIDNRLTEAQRDKELIDRDTFYSGAGIRLTGYYDDYILQYRFVTDTHGGNGVTSTARLGKSWQVKNWNFHGVVSAEYTSATTNRYWLGISAAEATTRFPEYDPGASVSFNAEVGVTYPLSKDWVFRSFARFGLLPDEQKNSPLADDDQWVLFLNSISYVF